MEPKTILLTTGERIKGGAVMEDRSPDTLAKLMVTTEGNNRGGTEEEGRQPRGETAARRQLSSVRVNDWQPVRTS